MRKSADKKRTDDSKLTPNKSFLVRFFTKNFQRECSTERSLRSFNFFLQKRTPATKIEIARVGKNTEGELVVSCRLLQTLLANMEENLKNPQLLPALNDLLFTMVGFVHSCLKHYHEEKVLKAEQWQQVELLVDLFTYARKWQNISEADLCDMIDKQLPAMSWVDQLPDLEKNAAFGMSEFEGLQVLAEWCTLDGLCQHYPQMFKQLLEQYMLTGSNASLQELVEQLTEKALIFKRSTLAEKLVRLCCSLRAYDQLNAANLKRLLERVYHIDAKQRSSRILREVLEAVALEDYLTADELLQTVLVVLAQLSQICSADMVKDTHRVATILARLSGYSTEVVQFDKAAVRSLYDTILKIIRRSQEIIPALEESLIPEMEADKRELLLALQQKRKSSLRADENLCTPFLNLINNCRKNPALFAAMAVGGIAEVLSAQEVTDSHLQKFILSTLPDLTSQEPPASTPSTSSFLLSLYLKMMVRFVNRRERIQPLFQREFESMWADDLTNYHFAVCFLLAQALTEPKQSIDLIITSCLQVLQELDPRKERLLLANLILLAVLTGQKDYPYLKISVRDLLKKLLDKPQLLKEEYQLPTPSSSEALLFSKHTPSYVPERIVELTRSLNLHTPHIRSCSQEMFYYILIELNSMCVERHPTEQLLRPAELDSIMRMRTTNSVSGADTELAAAHLRSAIEGGSSIELLHALIRLFCICESFTAEQVEQQQQLLVRLVQSLFSGHQFTNEELLGMWKGRKVLPTHIGEFNPYVNYCRDMQVVRFYCEAQAQPASRMYALTVQATLRLLLKLWCVCNFEASNELKMLHLLFLPIESIFLPKEILSSPLFMIYLKLAIYNTSTAPADKTLQEIKQSLEDDIDQVVALCVPSDNPVLPTIKFLQFDFLKTLVDRFLSEYEHGSVLPEDPFNCNMLAKLLAASPPLKEQVLKYFRSANLLPGKVDLLMRRLEYIFRGKHYALLENSRSLYQLFGQINAELQNGYLNRHVQAICQFDEMDDRAHSCYLMRELIQLKQLIRPDEELASHVFEYIAKLTEFYGEAKKGELLVLIPKLVCELFGIVAHSSDNKESLTTALQTLERTDKPTSCSSFGNPYSQSVFRCLDCEDKRLICHGCVLVCHEKHAIVFAASSPLGNRHPCQCASINSNPCKLKRAAPGSNQPLKREPRDNFINDLRMFRGRTSGGMAFDVPPSMHVQMNPMNPMNPLSTVGLPPHIHDLGAQSLSHPFKFADYGNPFDPRQDLARLERIARLDRYQHEPDFFEDDDQPSGLFESSGAGERRLRTRLLERKDNPNEPAPSQQPHPQPEEEGESDNYSELGTAVTKIEVEEHSTGDVIKGQSFLLQIFLQIGQELCMDRGRKASIIESENWRLNFQPPVLDCSLSTLALRLFPPGTFKTRLNTNNDNQIRDTSPFLVRKPIAVGRTLTLVLSSTTINVIQNKRIFVHLSNKTNMDAINHHGLNFECHSIEFCPNQPNQFCVAGLTSLQVLTINPEDGTIGKHAAFTYSNRNEYICKIQYLEIGVMIGDTRSLKLIQSKSPSLIIHGAKDSGLIKDWFVLRLDDEKFTIPTYLVVAASYNHLYTYQFDESDKGEKHFSNKLNFDLKKKGSGSAVHLGYLSDGRKYIVAGLKDKEGINFIGRLEPNLIESIAPLRFQGLHPAFEKSLNLGHIARVGERPDRMVFACTMKPETTKDTSSQAGQLTLFSLSQDEKFQVQPLQNSPADTKCEGLAVLPIDANCNAVLGLHEDGSLSIFVEGDPKKELFQAAIKNLEENLQSKEQEAEKVYEQTKKLVLEKIRLPMLAQIDAQPVIDFRDRSEPLRRDNDYHVEKNGQEVTFYMDNSNRIATGILLNHSHRVTLPTRVVENVLEVGFTTLEAIYFYSLGKVTVRLQKTGSVTNIQRRDRERMETLQELQLESYKKMALGYANRLSSGMSMSGGGDYELCGESIDNYQSRFRKVRDLLSEPKQDPATMHIKEIFLILEIFLREIRDTENSLLEREELLQVVEEFRPMLLRVDCSSYQEVKAVIELCLQIVAVMNGQPNPPVGSQLEPQTFTLEPLIKELEGQANCAYLLGELYRLALEDTQRFFFWVSRYRQLIKKLYKKYSLLLAKDDKMKGREHERQVDPAADKLLSLIIASYNILAVKNPTEGETLLSFIRSIFAKYGGGKQIRTLLYKYLVYFYDKRPEEWLTSVVPVEEGIVADFPEPALEEELIKEVEQMPPPELMYMDLPEEEQIRLALELSERDRLESQQNRHNSLAAMMPEVEEQKLDEEDFREMQPVVEDSNELKTLEPNLLVRDLFTMCLKAFEQDEALDTARQSIIIGYVLFKVLNKVNPNIFVVFLSSLEKWLRNLNTKSERSPSTATLSFLSMFGRIIQRSKLVTDNLTNPDHQYAEIKKLVLQRAKELIAKDPHPNKKNERVSMTSLLRNRPISDAKLSLPHSLLGLLRCPTELDPVILSLKCYWLLPKDHEEYQNQRDRVIYHECMISGDIDKMYKRARKRPETWRSAVDVEWLEGFISERKPGWTQALELLALYYDS